MDRYSREVVEEKEGEKGRRWQMGEGEKGRKAEGEKGRGEKGRRRGREGGEKVEKGRRGEEEVRLELFTCAKPVPHRHVP